MKFSKIKKIEKIGKKETYDITVNNNSNLFCNGYLIHNCGYRGEVKVIMINLNKEPQKIEQGERVAQGVITSRVSNDFGKMIKLNSIKELSETERGSGGFGSTGKN
jgi:deoxyuridine 5'-triphosphate nucleotidohydrolase